MNAVNISELMQLTIDERIQLVEDLWDSIAAEALAEPERLPVTAAQRRELERRSADHKQTPDEAIALDEALERIEHSLE
jgi:putative addiction module component (TIGR02574 family)